MDARCKSILTTVLSLGLILPCHAYCNDNKEVEIFQCGSLGRVVLTTSSNTAELSISSGKTITLGVIHSVMGGNDRTFTNSLSDNYRRPDETTKRNPFTLRILSGYVYGKSREQITIHTPAEAKTCIRITID